MIFIYGVPFFKATPIRFPTFHAFITECNFVVGLFFIFTPTIIISQQLVVLIDLFREFIALYPISIPLILKYLKVYLYSVS